jgi:hypothetical protein
MSLPLLNWLQDQHPHSSFTPGNIEMSWGDFLANLMDLQRQAYLRFRVLSGPICEIALAEPPSSGLPKQESKWVPSPRARMQLKQFGLSQGQIKDLTYQYNILQADHNDSDFIRFCSSQHISRITESFHFKKSWTPSPGIFASLEAEGIPRAKLEHEYLAFFRFDHGGKVLIRASWDDSFAFACRSFWNKDHDNPNADIPRPIKPDWEPADETVEKIASLGFDQAIIKQKAREYRLYWRDAGGANKSWEDHFYLWFSRQPLALQ